MIEESFSIFCVDLQKQVSLLSNRSILPAWLAKSDDFIFDALANNLDKLREDDRSLLKFIYTNIVDYCTVCTLSNSNLEFTLHLKENNYYIAYRFSVYSINGMELYGCIHKDGLEEIFNRQIMSGPITTFNDFKRFARKMLNDYDDVAFVQVDINNFKSINFKLGESYGDNVLTKIYSMLKTQFGCDGKVIHQVADVFTFVVRYYTKEVLMEAVRTVNAELMREFKNKFRLSWGIYFVERDNIQVRDMIDSAAIARRTVKNNVVSNIGVYTQIQKEKVLKAQEIEEHMFDALTNHEFKMFIQPKYDIKKYSVIGGEALIRWVKPSGEIIPPNDFIPIFENDSFVVKTDRYIWEEACKFIRESVELGHKLVPISVNISRVHLNNFDFIDYLDSLVDKYQIDKKFLQLEITESFNTKLHTDIFEELHNRDYILLMDDFGSGYSSLNTLQTSKFDVIKLDKDFLSNFLHSERGKKIISHIIHMIHDIELGVIAEGVETEEQARFLEKQGCSIAQGFLYAKPLTVTEFRELLIHDAKRAC